jgi:hypothetical protein
MPSDIEYTNLTSVCEGTKDNPIHGKCQSSPLVYNKNLYISWPSTSPYIREQGSLHILCILLTRIDLVVTVAPHSECQKKERKFISLFHAIHLVSSTAACKLFIQWRYFLPFGTIPIYMYCTSWWGVRAHQQRICELGAMMGNILAERVG